MKFRSLNRVLLEQQLIENHKRNPHLLSESLFVGGESSIRKPHLFCGSREQHPKTATEQHPKTAQEFISEIDICSQKLCFVVREATA